MLTIQSSNPKVRLDQRSPRRSILRPILRSILKLLILACFTHEELLGIRNFFEHNCLRSTGSGGGISYISFFQAFAFNIVKLNLKNLFLKRFSSTIKN